MRKAVAGVAIALVLATGCGADEEPAATQTPSPSATPTATAESEEPPSDELVVAPGRIGAAEAGMSRADAEATGLFDTDVEIDTPGCERVEPLVWNEEAGEGLDVLTDPEGTIVTMGVRDPSNLTTADGIGVGSTFGELVDAYGEDASEPAEAGYVQVGVFVQDGDAWLGALFDHDDPASLSDDEPITFLEVTAGAPPDLMRDGC